MNNCPTILELSQYIDNKNCSNDFIDRIEEHILSCDDCFNTIKSIKKSNIEYIKPKFKFNTSKLFVSIAASFLMFYILSFNNTQKETTLSYDDLFTETSINSIIDSEIIYSYLIEDDVFTNIEV